MPKPVVICSMPKNWSLETEMGIIIHWSPKTYTHSYNIVFFLYFDIKKYVMTSTNDYVFYKLTIFTVKFFGYIFGNMEYAQKVSLSCKSQAKCPFKLQYLQFWQLASFNSLYLSCDMSCDIIQLVTQITHVIKEIRTKNDQKSKFIAMLGLSINAIKFFIRNWPLTITK